METKLADFSIESIDSVTKWLGGPKVISTSWIGEKNGEEIVATFRLTMLSKPVTQSVRSAKQIYAPSFNSRT